MTTGFGYGDRPLDIAPTDAREAYFQANNIRLAHDFAGRDLVDDFGGLVLTPVNAPSVDINVINTLDGSPLASDPPSKLWSHAYKFTAGNQQLQTASATSIDFGVQSFLVHLTLKFLPQGATVELAGNLDATSGWSLKYTAAQMLQFFVKRSGFPVDVIDLAVVLDDDGWHDVVAIVDLDTQAPVPAPIARLGVINSEATSLLDLSGSLTSSAPFSIGKVSGLSVLGDVMAVRLALGPQVEGRSTPALAQASAKLIWWTDLFTRVATAPK